ncbi:MAG TPA: hypothetical protein VLF71_06110 [Candidatus Saccharimonadales bacterium]|nr:hypothetical protein [Candidatus Saccharimonadales bacterium]
MQPQQPYGQFPAPPPSNGNPYAFITDPSKQPKQTGGLPPVLRNTNSFVGKILLIVGGAVALVVVVGLIVTLIFSGKTNLGTVLKLVETQQEVVRVSGLATDTELGDTTVSGAAMNTKLAVTSQQQALVTYLTHHRQKVNAKDLALKKDPKTDQQINQAKATSTLDIVFAQVMRQELVSYAAELKTNYTNASSQTLRAILADDYNQTQLLLKQWPSN